MCVLQAVTSLIRDSVKITENIEQSWRKDMHTLFPPSYHKDTRQSYRVRRSRQWTLVKLVGNGKVKWGPGVASSNRKAGVSGSMLTDWDFSFTQMMSNFCLCCMIVNSSLLGGCSVCRTASFWMKTWLQEKLAGTWDEDFEGWRGGVAVKHDIVDLSCLTLDSCNWSGTFAAEVSE